MNKNIKYLAMAAVVGLASASLTSCHEWTEPESIDIEYPTAEDDPNYPAYLEDLRAYRATDHRDVYAWVNLSENGPLNESERLTSLPDSIDVLVLSTVGDIHPTVLADFAKVREQKGMKAIYQIDFDAIKAQYVALCEALSKQRSDLSLEYALREDANEPEVQDELAARLEQLADPDFTDYVLEALTKGLNYANNSGLDGVIFAFNGKATNHLTPAELVDYTRQENLFIRAAADWHRRHPEMKYDFLGQPQNISDPELLNQFEHLFIRQGLDATNSSLYSFYYTLATTDNVPTSKLGMMTTFISSDPDDALTGVFTNGTYALQGFAQWVRTAPVTCVGIQNVQNDYFTPEFTYPNVRAVIQAANPSIK